MFCACIFHGNSMNNLLSYCGLIDAKIRASDNDLPVLQHRGEKLHGKLFHVINDYVSDLIVQK